MSSSQAEVVVVGAGIVGAAIADRLAALGQRVCVVGDALAGGATAAGMGHVLVHGESDELLALTRDGRQRWIELSRELPASCEWKLSGTLWVARDQAQRAAALHMGRRLERAGARVELIESGQLEALEPCLAHGLGGALRVIDDATLYQPAATRFLLTRAVARQATLRLGRRAVNVVPGEVRLEDGSEIACERIVVAAGIASASLLGDRLNIGLRPKKGQLLITQRCDLKVRHHLVELAYSQSVEAQGRASVAFNVQPRGNGQLLIGSSRAYEGGRDFDRALASRMLRRCFEFLPALAEIEAIRAWTGLRCASEDGLPQIGPVGPSDPSGQLLLATGHEGYGITTALVSADLVAGHLGLVPLPSYASKFSPRRADARRACA